MFDAAAPRYDFLNRLLSAGVDGRWRRRTIAAVGLGHGDLLLDVCGGTGDLALTAVEQVGGVGALVVDFSEPMVARVAAKLHTHRPAGSVEAVCADACKLPVRSASARAAVIGFGIRNVATRGVALRECYRVLKPGGRLAVLEFSVPPRAWVRGLYLFYLRHLLPRVAGVAGADPRAYAYLGDSIAAFPDPRGFVGELEEAGFARVTHAALSLGIAALYVGERRS